MRSGVVVVVCLFVVDWCLLLLIVCSCAGVRCVLSVCLLLRVVRFGCCCFLCSVACCKYCRRLLHGLRGLCVVRRFVCMVCRVSCVVCCVCCEFQIVRWLLVVGCCLFVVRCLVFVGVCRVWFVL